MNFKKALIGVNNKESFLIHFFLCVTCRLLLFLALIVAIYAFQKTIKRNGLKQVIQYIQVEAEDKITQPEVKIYTRTGQEIATLSGNEAIPGTFNFSWNGKDENGNLVKPGIYLVMCSVGNKRTVRKVVYNP